MEFYLKYKKVALRFIGLSMLVIGFSLQFWSTPKEGVSEIEIAAANVARMEAKVKSDGKSEKKVESSANDYLEELKKNQEKQMEYLKIIAMLLGAVFLGYSFVKKEKP